MAIISTLLREIKNPTVIPNKIKDIIAKHIIVKKYKNNPKDFFFIQIGSNDGVTGDPIYKFITKYHWQGVLVEPVPYLFSKLKNTYSNNAYLLFENVAIHKEAGQHDFYRIAENNEPNQPSYYDKLGSFDKNFLISRKDQIANFDKYFVTEKVTCITFSDLIKKHSIHRIDLLNTDTEGYDYEIIKMIDFSTIKPKMILFESKHLSTQNMEACVKLLRDNDYKIIIKGGETFAYLD